MSKLGKNSKNVAVWLLAGTMMASNVYANEILVGEKAQESIEESIAPIIDEIDQNVEEVAETEQDAVSKIEAVDQEMDEVKDEASDQVVEEVKDEASDQVVEEVKDEASDQMIDEVQNEEVVEAIEEVQVEQSVAVDALVGNQEIFMGVQIDDAIDSVNQINKYDMTLDADGKIQIRLDLASKQALSVTLLDEDGHTVLTWCPVNNYSYVSGGSIYPVLRKGKYTVHIASYANKTGNYVLNVKYDQKYNVNETTDKHNTNETAQEVQLGTTLTALMTDGDTKDVYKFTTTAPVTCIQFEWSLDNKGYWAYSSYTKKIYDEQGRELNSDISYLKPGTYYIAVEKPEDVTGSIYSISLKYATDYPVTEIEDNDSYATANTIKLNGSEQYGGSTAFGDQDYYKFTVTEKDKINIKMQRKRYGNTYAYLYFEIRNEKGESLRQNWTYSDVVGNDSVTLDPGNYYLVMNSKGGFEGTYTVSLTSAKAQAFEEQQAKLNAFVKRLYEKCFNREADESGLNYWVGRLQKGEATGADLGKFFVNSKEILDAQLNDSDYLDILYGAFFNRDADDAGRAYWLSKLNNGNTRYGVLASFINSKEYADICKGYGIEVGVMELGNTSEAYPNITEFVYKFYQKCMGRTAGQEELNYWVGELVNGNRTGRSLAKFFVFSDEFQGKQLSNADYIEEMYQVFFERASDIPGKAHWLGQLESGASKEEVFNGFVQSDEFKYSCKVAGVTY